MQELAQSLEESKSAFMKEEQKSVSIFNLAPEVTMRQQYTYQSLIQESPDQNAAQMKRLRKLVVLALSIIAFMRLYLHKEDDEYNLGWIDALFKSLEHQLKSDKELLDSYNYVTNDVKKNIQENGQLNKAQKAEYIKLLDRYYQEIYQEIKKYENSLLKKVNLNDLQVDSAYIKNRLPSSLSSLLLKN